MARFFTPFLAACTLSVAPFLLLWTAETIFDSAESAVSHTATVTPNPTQAPDYFPTPIDSFVGLDPWLAGTAWFIIPVWIAVVFAATFFVSEWRTRLRSDR